MTKKKILIFIISYNHETLLTKVLERIPRSLRNHPTASFEILVIEDCSKDNTFKAGRDFLSTYDAFPATILSNPVNLGFGGNQKLGYEYAITNQFDYVALVHGDGQYAPELLPELIEPLLSGEADAVFGSRMLDSTSAIKGGMPRYKWLGNKVLTALENFIVGSNLSEWHSGFRLYSVEALRNIPLQSNSDYYDFDTDIIIQLIGAGYRIKELPIPTFYGDEVCNVNGLKYARKIILACLLFRAQDLGLFYHPKFHLESRYRAWDSATLPQTIKERIAEQLSKKPGKVILVDDQLRQGVLNSLASLNPEVLQIKAHKLTPELLRQYSIASIIVMDSFESSPSLENTFRKLLDQGALGNTPVYIIGANVGFCLVRLALLFGSFNYGSRGILDSRHQRLYTFSSMRQTLTNCGFDIVRIQDIPVPWEKTVKWKPFCALLRITNRVLCRISKGLFAYQFLYEVEAKVATKELLYMAKKNTAQIPSQQSADRIQ
jgi:glycosyltransferase involved in cell wall biosynthesis